MVRVTLALLVFILLIISGCQSYNEGLQRSVARADEASAIAALHNISNAERTYSVTNNGEYGTLQQLTEAGLLDSRFSSPRPLKDYILTLNVSSGEFACNADPDTSRQLQGRHLYIGSADGVIHIHESQPASATDPALQ